ncbi:hypothetical protein CC80DRAFT_526135 [Byssothecium circinans]|uniref:Uncharacterized protein n=1 Tax=Byssothecium circinans TaxID=147558 RepID=A0A6A5TTW5_9PLEO|nr:hypothetical protein CC80DRAFT_526135 [Byssothecium circinans]
MGLPIWRAPSPEADRARDAPKADPTANARSPIRRRRGDTRTSRRPMGGHMGESAIPPDFTSSSRPSSAARPRLPPPPVPESRNYLRAPPLEPSTHAPGPSADEDSSSRNMSRLTADAPRGLSFDDRRSLPALTPNFAPAAALLGARHDSAYDIDMDIRDRSSYRTPRRIPPYHSEMLHYARQHREDSDDGSSDNAVGFPLLRRMGRRNIADGPLPSSSLRESWSPVSTVDGLGDRERSLSPVADHWEPMLSSVAPDPLAPTADSSFTSAAASASFSNSQPSSRSGSSNSNSASSSRTHLTVPSRIEQFSFDQFLHICDTSDDDSASDTEAEEEGVEAHPTSSHPFHARSGIRSSAMRNPYRYSRRIRDQVLESTANVRSFYGEVTTQEPERQVQRPAEDQLDGSGEDRAEERTTDEELPLDQELRDARALLERLVRRDDVGDDFWTSVGLRRPLADRVERIQQRERL